MGNYRNISQSFWTDSKVDDDFTPEDKYFYLYLLTNPHTNICGCYEVSKKQMVQETGYNGDTVMRLLERFQDIHDVIRYDPDTKEVLIINWGKYNWSRSQSTQIAVLKCSKYIKNDKFRDFVQSGIARKEIDIETKTETEIETETETDTDTDALTGCVHPVDTLCTPSKKKEFVQPTLEEVEAYCQEKGYGWNPQEFIDHYISNGWMVGKTHMKDWKAAVRNWETMRKKFDQEKKGKGFTNFNERPAEDHDALMDRLRNKKGNLI